MPFRLGTTGSQPLATVMSPAFCSETTPQGCQHRGSWQDHLPGSPALVFRLRSHHRPSPPSFYSHRTLCCCLLPRDQHAIIPNPSQSGNQNTTQREQHALDELERHGSGDPETTLHLWVWKDGVTSSGSQVIAVVFMGPEAKSPSSGPAWSTPLGSAQKAPSSSASWVPGVLGNQERGVGEGRHKVAKVQKVKVRSHPRAQGLRGESKCWRHGTNSVGAAGAGPWLLPPGLHEAAGAGPIA